MTQKILPTALLALGLAVGVAPSAQAHDPGHDRGAKIEKHMEQAAQRLKLTDAQKQELRPIIDEHVTQAKAIRAKYPKEATPEQKQQMRDEMRSIREDYDTRFRAVLTAEQQQEWEQMRSERRDRMREHQRERKDAGTT